MEEGRNLSNICVFLLSFTTGALRGDQEEGSGVLFIGVSRSQAGNDCTPVELELGLGSAWSAYECGGQGVHSSEEGTTTVILEDDGQIEDGHCEQLRSRWTLVDILL